uniref:broad substrate specificity ATP-binding cassette transporter ABCG2 n=1 Tax=Myxine glutinosa TaxID=7769 RepID=UPI00358EFC6B
MLHESTEQSHQQLLIGYDKQLSSMECHKEGAESCSQLTVPVSHSEFRLLDILAGRKHPSGLSGDVLVDGVPLPPDFKCRSGYVVQDDVVMGTLTVRENLAFSAALRISNSPSLAERKERVERLLLELGITAVADSKVGTALRRGVSGGERKRTNIGMELITDPGVLFLDEPTTGLDASTANAVMRLLHRLSSNGKTIIFSIHQPRYSIFKLFDSITLLADGHMIFHGPAQEALSYFSANGYECEAHNNPADFFLDVVNGDSTALDNKLENAVESHEELKIVERLSKQYSHSSFAKQTTQELERIEQMQIKKGHKKHFPNLKRNSSTASSFFTQMSCLLKRTFLNLVRSPQASIAQLLVTLILGLIVGAIFFGVSDDAGGIQNRVGAMFFLTTNQCFGSLSAVELFISERKIFVHEYISGYYHVSSYFISRISADLLPMRTLPGIIFSLLTYWMMGLQPKVGNFFIYLLTIIMVAYGATSLALALSAGSSNAAVAHIYITISFVFMILFSGLLVNLPSVMAWLSWIQYFSIPRYGMAALQMNELWGLNFTCRSNNYTVPDKCPPTDLIHMDICTGEQYLCQQGIKVGVWEMWQNHVALGVMTLIFFTIAYLRLLFIRKYT